MAKSAFIVLMSLLFSACHEQNKNTVSTAELMKSREIKKVSDAEILKKGGEVGNEILNAVLEIVSRNVNTETVNCEVDSWKAIDSLETTYQSRIERLNSNNQLISELELQLLAAYQYNLENNEKPTSSIQKLNSKTILYTYPIDSASGIFKYCLDSIGQKKVELWSVKIPIKEIINEL